MSILNISDCDYCFEEGESSEPRFERGYLFGLLLSFGVATVLGNSLIILAVFKKKSLHTATNYFITSLAIADFLVGLVVMPFSATYEAMDQRWIFGPDMCDIWHSMDVLASTASILNLCVISLDRYWAITDPMTYPYKMTGKKAAILIVLVWVCSSAISFPAIAWWRLVAEDDPPKWKCPFTEDMGYLIFSSTVSFYGPLTIMVFAYAKIYRAALEHTRSLKLGAKVLAANDGGPESTLRIHRGGGGGSTKNNNVVQCTLVNRDKNNFGLSKRIMKFSKEKKAAKTLGTVMGVFIICWLPFFITNIISGLCSDCIANPDFIIQVVTWLGWINSGMNPAIYAYCSKDFRRAFISILCIFCRKKRRHHGMKMNSNSSSHELGNKSYRFFNCCHRSKSNTHNLDALFVGDSQIDGSEPPREWIERNGSNHHQSSELYDDYEESTSKIILNNCQVRYYVFKTHQSPQSPQQQHINQLINPSNRRKSELNLYSIPPPNYRFDPKRSIEKLL